MGFGPKRTQAHVILGAYQDVTASRSFGSDFTNNTGSVLAVTVTGEIASGVAAEGSLNAVVAGLSVLTQDLIRDVGNNLFLELGFIVPIGAVYRVNAVLATLAAWREAEFS